MKMKEKVPNNQRKRGLCSFPECGRQQKSRGDKGWRLWCNFHVKTSHRTIPHPLIRSLTETV